MGPPRDGRLSYRCETSRRKMFRSSLVIMVLRRQELTSGTDLHQTGALNNKVCKALGEYGKDFCKRTQCQPDRSLVWEASLDYSDGGLAKDLSNHKMRSDL